ncbi:CGI-121-domain-containing protein [Coniochaeta ligniaria NRRL 30616]|uniref:EKC/KEOPS complex subunit CGI121 n=1 Tax=Coniochaeta ligniaria NRRL 30616 TaxID=1408157 RepID=A0A1J7IRP4_9PEZI|nr:CGI-121-domain-containing protein [Coniochaeta ligniaria NRRL 30616]
MSLEEIRLEHVPDTHRVYVGLFRAVSNAGYLQSQLVARNSDFEYAFIDASSVLSRLQLLAAVYKALTVLLDGTLKTPNVHSEIVCSLSPSNNISEAYRRWGITDTTKDVVIVKVLFPTESRPQPPSASEVFSHLTEAVKGTPAPLTDAELAECTDWPKVRKYYKLNGAPTLDGKDDAAKTREMGLLALGGMALRGL